MGAPGIAFLTEQETTRGALGLTTSNQKLLAMLKEFPHVSYPGSELLPCVW